MYASILNITFDCVDAKAQAMFWAAVTGWSAQERDATPGHVEYAVVPPSQGTPRLYFVTVPEPKRVKNRIHLDLVPPRRRSAGRTGQADRPGCQGDRRSAARRELDHPRRPRRTRVLPGGVTD